MVKNYGSYSTAAFLDDPYFISWVKGPTPEADAFWKEWIAGEPANLASMRDAELQLRAILSASRLQAEESDAAEVWQKVQHTLEKKTALPAPDRTTASVRQINRKGWLAAAAVVGFLVLGGLFLLGREGGKQPAVAALPGKKVEDIAPGGNKAVLTLANGSRVILDSADNGALTRQGGITVIKLADGQLSYQPSSNASSTGEEAVAAYNTITTPNGGQYQLVLADGTKVWLNAASSLRYPAAFTGKQRTVELNGEGYFEVAHHPQKPFRVKIMTPSGVGGEVQVLGTQFNINAYGDEPSVNTTLLEGRVAIEKQGRQVFLNPGQQAIFQPGQEAIKIANDVDVAEVVAWKNGRFQYSSASIQTIMRQVARWYDVEVVYQNPVTETFSGGLPRSENVSQLLKMLEATGTVKFEVDGKRIVVKQQ